MLDIAGGHLLAGFLYALGSSGFSSISATGNIAFPVAKILDAEGKPTGETGRNMNPDQVAFTGILKDLNAIASIHLHGGLKTSPGRSFVWTIDGEEGTIKVEGSSVHLNIKEPTLTLNGEPVNVVWEGAGNLVSTGVFGNISRAWMSYAKGSGYTTIEDALEIKRIIDAVTRSAKEGRRIEL